MAEKLTMLLSLSSEEMLALEQLVADHDMSEAAVMRQALRFYQLTQHRLSKGETMRFSGDRERAAAFTGVATPAPSIKPDDWVSNWHDIKTAPKGKRVLVKFPSGEVEVCYQTDHGGGLKDTWRFAFAERGRQAPWPVEWCEIPRTLTVTAKDGDA